jgi:hypothetical protein
LATGFAIDLKLAGTTHGLGWATNAVLSNKTAAPVNKSFIVFIIIWF